MKIVTSVLALLLMVCCLFPLPAQAVSDGIYSLVETVSAWDGAAGDRLAAPSADYDYTYGDEGSVTYTLPWAFSYYGQSYGQITADTNGAIWFSSADPAYSFDLAATGRGPVIAAWHDDLSSYYDGAVFIRHKTNPERVVIEWQTETYSDEGYGRPNNFEAVIYPDGSIRLDYREFAARDAEDHGSGISRGDGAAFISFTPSLGNAFSLAGRSFIVGNGRKLAVVAQQENFGDQCTGTTSQFRTVTAINSGSDSLVIDSVTLNGGTPAMYALAGGGDGCTGRTLLPGESCTVRITFTPTAVGTFHGALTLLSGNPTPLVQEVALSGTGRYPTLTVTKSDLGSGTVTGSAGNIACGAVCFAQYLPDEVVTLSAVPDAGSVFTGWSGSCSGTGTCTVVMNDFKQVAASFSSTTPPTVTIASPSGLITTNRPVLHYSTNSGSVAVKVDGAVVTTVSGDRLDTLSEGAHVIRVEATNKAGITGVGESPVTVDTLPPEVTRSVPAAGAGEVPLETSVAIHFSEPLDPTSISRGMVSLTSQGADVPGTVSLSPDGMTVTFKPDNILANASTFIFTLKSGARDHAGNIVLSDFSFSFTTTAKVSVLIENKGSSSAPYVLAADSYTAITIRNSFVMTNGPVTADTVMISENSTLTQKATGLTGMESLDLTVSGELYLDATSRIDVSGRGYLGAWQGGNNSDRGRTKGNTSGSTASTGAGYGGRGGYSTWGGTSNDTYGAIDAPDEPGSGGGGNGGYYTAGNGGGLVRLVTGSLTLNGRIRADGMTTNSGGGSGGGVYIVTGVLSGAGSISAQGGGSTTEQSCGPSGCYGSGGGGRIAIHSDTISLPIANIKAMGGSSGNGSDPRHNGGAGTIYLKNRAGAKADIIINNWGNPTNSVTDVPGSDYGLFEVKNGVVSVTGSMSPGGDMVITGSSMKVIGGLTVPANLTLDGSSLNVTEPVSVAQNLILTNGSLLSHVGATIAAEYRLDVTAASIDVDATSKINVTGKGYLGGRQGDNASDIGRTATNVKAGNALIGGSYGGRGGTSAWGGSPNDSYGSLLSPNEPGSGGGANGGPVPGGNGGGLVRLTADSLTLNGSITADGMSVTGGGGSGGGIFIDVGTLSGSGVISASGGSSTINYGSGSGGRIAIYYGSNSLPPANVLASGGSSGDGSIPDRNGAPGTIYLKDKATPTGNVIISNGGRGTRNMTDVSSAANMTFGDLTLDGGNIGMVTPLKVAGTLTMRNGSLLTHPLSSSLSVTATSVVVDSSSSIDVTGKGYLGSYQGDNNSEIGQTAPNVKAGSPSVGGSYGGRGGISAWGGSPNDTYGNEKLPNELGSGGGGNRGSASGGNGGGFVRLVAGSLMLNGTIRASGMTSRGGGGSGGGIYIDAGMLSGTGMIIAQGGGSTELMCGSSGCYGSGGGGRIAVYFDTNTLPVANVQVSGGKSGNGYDSARNGGAGTIYLQQKTRTLSVSLTGTGTGTVVSSPAGISCGTACSNGFPGGSVVTLTPLPGPGSTFSGWGGLCSGTNACTVTMASDRNITATFTEIPLPIVTITAPSGLTNNNEPILQYTVSGGTVEVQVDGMAVGTRSGNSLGPLADGVHLVRVVATNSAGKSTFAETAVTVDTTSPQLAVSTLPDLAATNNVILNITGTATDSNQLHELRVNDAVAEVNGDGSFSYALVLQSGANTVTVIATDLAGNQVSDTRRITLDQAAPQLSVTQPADNAKTGSALLTVSGNVDETSTVTVKLGDSVQAAALTGSVFSADVTLIPGYNTIEITATDLAGNPSSQKRSVLFDDQKPSLFITEPHQDIRTNKSSITIGGTASEPYTAVGVTIGMEGQTYTPQVVSDIFSQIVTFTDEKLYPIIVTATNEVGTQTTAQRNVFFDRTPPDLTIDPVTSPTNAPNQLLTGTREEGTIVTVTCPTATAGMVEYPTTTTWRIALSGLTQGENRVNAETVDLAGNRTTAYAGILYVPKAPDVIVSASPHQLWPPNKKLVPVTITGNVVTFGSEVREVTISVADEYGKYNLQNLKFDDTVWLEAWREGADKDGRVYTITAVATDGAGNRTTRSATVVVPHDKGK